MEMQPNIYSVILEHTVKDIMNDGELFSNTEKDSTECLSNQQENYLWLSDEHGRELHGVWFHVWIRHHSTWILAR